MMQYEQVFKRYSKYIYYGLSLFVLGWGFTPYQSFFLALILGTVVSFFNIWQMHRKVNKFGQAIIKGKKVRSLGMFLRMATVGFAVYIYFRYPHYFSLAGLIIGLMTPYFVIMIDMFFNMLRLRKRGE